jgi:hypothetical protein
MVRSSAPVKEIYAAILRASNRANRQRKRTSRFRVTEPETGVSPCHSIRGWSHGDASIPNVIYNQKTGRARLVDFEIMHERSLSENERHADDLLVFLLDLVARVSDRRWLPFALAFLRAYDDFEVVRVLRKRLVIPTDLALIWWNVRTNFAKAAKENE